MKRFYLKYNFNLTKLLTIHTSLLACLVIIGVASCNIFEAEKTDQPIARAFDQYLYHSDIADIIPDEISNQDSAIITNTYIDTWVRTQLMLNKAKESLSDEQKNVNKKIEEYRSSLLIYSYRQKLLLQKMDTVISNKEISDYYEKNIDNFKLTSEIVKAIFVKVPVTAPNIDDVRNWIRSGSIDNLDKLEKYCINYADKFDVFNNSWVYFNTLMKQVPVKINHPNRFLRYNSNIETSDSHFHYFVHISEHKSEGEKTPLEFINNDIKSILLNKRKIEFYNDLEKKVYNEGVNQNLFEIY